MRISARFKVFLIFVSTLIASYIALPKNFNFLNLGYLNNLELKLGLDLAGGAHLVFEADTSSVSPEDKKEALESAKDIISSRVNLFGVSEPNVQTSSFEGKDRIIVELPGVNNTKDAVEIIGKTAKLEFRQFNNIADASVGATMENTKPTGLTGADFAKAQAAFDQQTGNPVISFTIKKGESAKKFSEVTGALIGDPLAIFVDEVAISWPVVSATISDSGIISGNFSIEGARSFAKILNAGALPIDLKLIEERTVGASLGADSIKKSIYAGIIGLFMVVIFMILSYRGPGFIAVFALFVFATFSLALYKLIPIVLTLPGVAGFLLSVGMAVDANILIFERLKEERNRRHIKDALELSFGKAWDAIRDANMATLLTAAILANPLDFSFLHTSGPVRGFAVTLSLGIVVSMFTGIVVSRNLLRVFVREGRRA